MPRLLAAKEIDRRLKRLNGWRRRGKFITKEFQFEGFMEGISFIGMVASVAEKEEHHPDIRVRYTTVTLSIQTHSEGGVTERDVALAKRLDEALSRSRLRPLGQKTARFAKRI